MPVIGLCLGAQLLVLAAGGNVYRTTRPRWAGSRWMSIPAAAADPVLGAMPERFTALQWHYYGCELPPGAVELARYPVCVQAFRIGEAAWGTQFHIEVTRDILLTWMRWGGEELEKAGYSNERYLAELESHIEAHEAIGRGMADRFAEVAARRARSAA